MQGLAPTGFLTIGAAELEYRMIGPEPDGRRPSSCCHEGLGSAALWGDFPDRLQAATGRGVRLFARRLWRLVAGRTAAPARLHADRGARCPAEAAREDRLSPRLLVGHSDGASIATIYAAACRITRVRGSC